MIRLPTQLGESPRKVVNSSTIIPISFHLPTTAIEVSTCTVKWQETKIKDIQVLSYILTCGRHIMDYDKLYVVFLRYGVTAYYDRYQK